MCHSFIPIEMSDIEIAELYSFYFVEKIINIFNDDMSMATLYHFNIITPYHWDITELLSLYLYLQYFCYVIIFKY